MLSKFFFNSMIIFFILNVGNTLDAQGGNISSKNSLINKFCIASLKSKLDIKDKQNLNEISNLHVNVFSKNINQEIQ